LLIVGVFFYIFRKTETSRGIGLAVLGLAMVFLSMDIISGAVRVLAVDHDFQTVLGVIVNHPWWLFVFAAAITLSVQSSTATVGLVMAVAEGSGVNGALVIPSILGANLGIGFTCLMVGWPTIEGRRLGAAALVLRALIALSAMSAIGWLVPLLSSRQVAPIREAAEIHAAFNLLALAASILVGGLVGSVVRRAVAVDSSREVLLPQTALDELALPTPSFALNNAARETLSMLEEVKRMVKDVWIGYETSDLPLVREVQARDARVDRYNTSIRNYLSRIPVEVLTPRDSHVQFGLLHFVSQLEDVADVVDKLLCRQIAKHIENPRAMLVDDIADLTTMHHKVLQRFDLAILIFTTRDRSYASSFTKASKEIEEWCIEAERRHYARVVATVDASGIKGSTYFLDILNAQRRIAGQINTIGHTFGLMR
jgi:phosphate:Na+ symporter